MHLTVDNFRLTLLLVALVLSAFSACRPSTQTNTASQTVNSHAPDSPGPLVEDKGDLKLRFQARKNGGAAATQTAGSSPQVIEKVIGELNQRLILPFDIFVSFEDCSEANAYYDPEAHQVTICHQLVDEYYDLFSIKIKDKGKLDEAVKAAAAATFFHELGHGLVDAWKIPITGREEDAVDQLSTLVLIEGTEDGEKMALAGALSFKLYADLMKGEKKIYWDEHSLDEQRFFDTICLIYGHDEEKYDYLIEDGTLPEERAGLCTEDYEKLSKAWHQLLTPYLKQQAEPREKLKLR